MSITIDLLEDISRKYGESFYLLDSKQFEDNFEELQKSFRDIYPNTYIAYSYKTNYTPKLCKLVNKHGGYAEVVSDMEYKLARKVGVKPQNIIFNGPYKNEDAVEKLLIDGGTVNIDSNYELEVVRKIAENHPNKIVTVGIRCNFDINDSVISRFGFDVDGEDFINALNSLRQISNINIQGLHCHFATRRLETFYTRAEKMLELTNKYFDETPDYIGLGGGLFGKMNRSLSDQFSTLVPSYSEYAAVVAGQFRDFYQNKEISKQPKLVIEPGSAIVGDVMKFVAQVINIKDIRGKKIATVSGSIYNVNPTLNQKNLPITIYHNKNNINAQQDYVNLDFGGYTCIESDYLYKGYTGQLAIGDYVVFENVGSYSIVLKPPFILPNFAIIDYNSQINSVELIKRRENPEDIFMTFEF